MLYNDMVLKLHLVNEKLNELNTEKQFHRHLKISTFYLAGSFYLSAFLNYILAQSVFKNIDPLLSENDKIIVLNEQIAEMTWKGYGVIMIPSMLVMFAIFWHLLHGIKKYTGLSLQEVMQDHHLHQTDHLQK